jgi:hypothetical protein
LDERRSGRRGDEEEGGVERLLEEVRREFSGLLVYVGVGEGYLYVKRTAPMDRRQFKKYVETCRRLGFRFDRRGERWVKPLEDCNNLQRYKPASTLTQPQQAGHLPLPPGPHASSYGQANRGGGRIPVPPQKRRAFPPHAWRRLAGAVEVVRGAEAKRRRTLRERGLTQARRRPSTGQAC